MSANAAACEEFRLQVHRAIDNFHPWHVAESLLSCEERALFGNCCRELIPYLNALKKCTRDDSFRQDWSAGLARIRQRQAEILRPYLTSVVRDRHEELLLTLDACLRACAETTSWERLAAWETDMRKDLRWAEDIILERATPDQDS
jgi:hypothetical protein